MLVHSFLKPSRFLSKKNVKLLASSVLASLGNRCLFGIPAGYANPRLFRQEILDDPFAYFRSLVFSVMVFDALQFYLS